MKGATNVEDRWWHGCGYVVRFIRSDNCSTQMHNCQQLQGDHFTPTFKGGFMNSSGQLWQHLKTGWSCSEREGGHSLHLALLDEDFLMKCQVFPLFCPTLHIYISWRKTWNTWLKQQWSEHMESCVHTKGMRAHTHKSCVHWVSVPFVTVKNDQSISLRMRQHFLSVKHSLVYWQSNNNWHF